MAAKKYAEKYFDREPRYVLSSNDSKFFCFVTHKNRKRSYAIDLTNVSTTGIAFSIEDHLTPNLGEYIKMEFHVPGYEQLACVGRVVRLEVAKSGPLGRPSSSPLVQVALVFENLTSAQQKALHAGLSTKLRTQKLIELKTKWGSHIGWMASHLRLIAMVTVAVATVALIFFWLLQPSESYLKSIPIPWGTRYN